MSRLLAALVAPLRQSLVLAAASWRLAPALGHQPTACFPTWSPCRITPDDLRRGSSQGNHAAAPHERDRQPGPRAARDLPERQVPRLRRRRRSRTTIAMPISGSSSTPTGTASSSATPTPTPSTSRSAAIGTTRTPTTGTCSTSPATAAAPAQRQDRRTDDQGRASARSTATMPFPRLPGSPDVAATTRRAAATRTRRWASPSAGRTSTTTGCRARQLNITGLQGRPLLPGVHGRSRQPASGGEQLEQSAAGPGSSCIPQARREDAAAAPAAAAAASA